MSTLDLVGGALFIFAIGIGLGYYAARIFVG